MIEQRAWTQRTLPVSYVFRDFVERLTDRAAFILRRYRIDVPVLRVLMHASLTVEARGSAEGASAPRSRLTAFVPAFVLSSLFGVLLGLVEAFALQVVGAASLLAGSMLFYGALTASSTFAALLFDRETTTFVSGRPIDDRTAMVARLLPPTVFNASILGAFAAPQCAAIGLRHGLWPALPLSVVIASLASVLGLGIILALFAALLRLLPADRFKTVLGRIQIGIALLTFVAPNLFPMLNRSSGSIFDGGSGPLSAWFPPHWYAALMAFATGANPPPGFAAMGLGIVAPFVLLAIAMWAASGRFVAAMAATDAVSVRARRPRAGLLDRLARFFTRNALERAGYSLCAVLQIRGRASILQIVPGIVIGMSLVLSMCGGIDRNYIQALPFLPYAIVVVLPQIATGLSRSECHDAAWIVHASPAASIHPILIGALRATIVRFVVVPGVIVITFAGLLGGAEQLCTAAVATIGALALMDTALRKFQYSLPFSEPVRPQSEIGIALVKSVLTIMGGFALMLTHSVASLHVIAHLVFAAIVLGLAIRGWRALDRKQALGVMLDEI